MIVVIEKMDGVWVFPLEGFVCAGSRHNAVGDVDLILHREDFSAAARIGLGAERRAVVESLVEGKARVKRVAATDNAMLLAEFDGSKSLEVPPGEYEEWEIEGAGYFAVAPAGGGEPAIWDGTSKTYRVVDGKVLEATEGEGE